MNEEFLKNNPIALRACVMYEFVRRCYGRLNCDYHWSSSFSMYRDVCKVIGYDVMKFSEFDFWYHRFLNGEFDLSFERDKEKKIHELTDMPIVVMEKIAENLNFFDRLALERTSRSLRTFIIHQKQSIRAVEFDFQNNKAGIKLNENTKLKYFDREESLAWKACSQKAPRLKFRRAYWEEATQGLKKILKYPKLHLDTLKASFVVYDVQPLISIPPKLWKKFDAPTNQLHLRKLDVKVVSLEILSKLLPCLKPGYLTKIVLSTVQEKTVDELEELAKLEQWKQAKYFSTKGTLFMGPMRYLYHFEEFFVRLEKLSVEDIREMKEILFKSPVFEACFLVLNNPVDVGQEFGDAIPGRTNIYHYPIPKSNKYFEIKVEEQKKIEISRKNK